MNLSTKSLSSLLVASRAVPDRQTRRRVNTRYYRILRRHDRKGELQAELLQMQPVDMKAASKSMRFEDLLKTRGFKSLDAFRLALFGKLRLELLRRGWTRRKIDDYVELRTARLS